MATDSVADDEDPPRLARGGVHAQIAGCGVLVPLALAADVRLHAPGDARGRHRRSTTVAKFSARAGDNARALTMEVTRKAKATAGRTTEPPTPAVATPIPGRGSVSPQYWSSCEPDAAPTAPQVRYDASRRSRRRSSPGHTSMPRLPRGRVA